MNEIATAKAQREIFTAQLYSLDSVYEVLEVNYLSTLLPMLQDALTLNSQVNASTEFEQNEKTFYNIALTSFLFQDGILTEPQLDSLKTVAASCPKTGGLGVYRARGILTGCDAEGWNDDTQECYPRIEYGSEQILEDGFSTQTVEYSESKLFVYPNPTIEGFFVKLPFNQSGKVTLADGLGRTWKETQVDLGQSSNYIDLERIPPGLYFCTVRLSSGERHTTKIFVSSK